MKKEKEEFSIHNSGGYRRFFENSDLEGLKDIFNHLLPHKEQLQLLCKTELILLIAHCNSIENRQKQPQIINIFTTIVVFFLGLIFSFFPKPINTAGYGILLIAALGGMYFYAVPQLSKSVGSYMENMVYVTMFRELAELVLKEREACESNQDEHDNEAQMLLSR